jgi:hypothetical protein
MLKKKIWANFQRIIELFTQKIVTRLSKIWGWDPRSGKNIFRIPDPGVKKGTGSQIPDPDPQHPKPTLELRLVFKERFGSVNYTGKVRYHL